VRPRRVLEYGCNVGDLLGHLAEATGAECVGVEPSAKAIERGRRAFGDQVRLCQGTIADNEVNADPAAVGTFDLVIVDDVFCWVSRETLFQSVANIDDALAEGGHLYVREFAPLQSKRNRNHHVEGAEVYCYKPAGLHCGMFTASGSYAVVWQEIWIDRDDPWVQRVPGRLFEARWSDAILRKSHADYFA
jgi:SAM-dependent methyltransferase